MPLPSIAGIYYNTDTRNEKTIFNKGFKNNHMAKNKAKTKFSKISSKLFNIMIEWTIREEC